MNKDLYIILSSNNFIDHTYRTLKVCLFMKFTTYTFSLPKSFDGDFLEGATARDGRGRNVRRILVRGVNAPLPPEANFF